MPSGRRGWAPEMSSNISDAICVPLSSLGRQPAGAGWPGVTRIEHEEGDSDVGLIDDFVQHADWAALQTSLPRPRSPKPKKTGLLGSLQQGTGTPPIQGVECDGH